MNLALITRRALVTTGVTIGLMAGAVAIRTAADWTSAAASKAQAPSGMEELATRIAAEQTRSAVIRAQIERLADGSDQLAGIIEMANLVAQADEASADALKAELVDAKDRLASLELAPQVTPAPVRRATTTTRTTTTATTATPAPAPAEHEEDDHHDERDEHDDD